jgi:hypothetical protein
MIVRTTNTHEVVRILNEALATDVQAISALVAARVPCNEALADHPTIQVGTHDGVTKVGILGIINGFFGIGEDGYGAIEANLNQESGLIVEFRLRFDMTTTPRRDPLKGAICEALKIDPTRVASITIRHEYGSAATIDVDEFVEHPEGKAIGEAIKTRTWVEKTAPSTEEAKARTDETWRAMCRGEI